MAFASPSASSSSIIAVHDLNTSGTRTYPFTIPQAAQSIIGKIWLDGTWSASGSALVFLQTSEDGGTTWRDCSVTSIGAATPAALMNNLNAHFICLGVAQTSSRGVANYIGSVAATSLVSAQPAASAAGTVSGMPMMGTLGQIVIVYSNTITTSGVNVQVFAPTTDYTS